MGEFIAAPIAIAVILLIVYVTFAFRSTSKAGKERASLPDEPQARREEDIRRMKQEHAQANAPMTRADRAS